MFRKMWRYAAVLIVGMMVFLAAAVLDVSSRNVADGNYVIVRYLHGSFRCASCRKIEQYTQEALDNNFSEEFQKGKLVYKVVNVENKENAHFIEDYGLYTKSVVVALVEGGKEIKHKNLEKVWEYLGDKQKFCDYIVLETKELLSELPEVK
ncbi:MAG: hypothetical protein KJ995_02755 [Candidatus Omnitrophica bacterium]|nr:hypothetical protein [Candidatus Omnitrophota bacterium]MBU1127599.1 hypothetical protein [Candidatus Omnitrophota bacterium]MBU1656826.1 hypothetical protein [Candidatus Omnitrophota bacterium]MBU1783886.1 hypothetical protein [Candidatus Omnitrophota bacterium]MBU1851308.1 hypothetical protein [Candidatus Omnitrophota bacterium]